MEDRSAQCAQYISVRACAGRREVRKLEFYKLSIEQGELFTEQELFSNSEKERAETILKALEGMRIISAQALLEKCKEAVMQCQVSI